MIRTLFDELQIMALFCPAENGVAVPELCREHEISTVICDKWRFKYSGMDALMMRQSEP